MDAYLARFDQQLEQELDLELSPWPSLRSACLRVGGLPCRLRRQLRRPNAGS